MKDVVFTFSEFSSLERKAKTLLLFITCIMYVRYSIRSVVVVMLVGGIGSAALSCASPAQLPPLTQH